MNHSVCNVMRPVLVSSVHPSWTIGRVPWFAIVRNCIQLSSFEHCLVASVPSLAPLFSSHVSLESFRINFNHIGNSVCLSVRPTGLFASSITEIIKHWPLAEIPLGLRLYFVWYSIEPHCTLIGRVWLHGPESFVVPQQVKKLPALTRRFTKARRLSLFWAGSFQSTPSPLI